MQDPEYVKGAFARIADRYVITNHVLSLWTDILWRKKVGRIVKEWSPSQLLDIATGTGDLALDGVQKTLVADALDLPVEDASYDVVSVAFGLRNMADYSKALEEMNRVLRPGGHLLILDFSIPTNILRKPYIFYLDKVLPHLAGAITQEPDAYHYLSGSIQQFPAGFLI